jgi:predicted ester cyclase
MSAEENRELIRSLYAQGFNQGNVCVVDEVFDPRFIDRSTPEQEVGIQGVKDYIAMVRAGFPDLLVTIEDLVAEEDKIVARTSWRGTHRGDYEGIPPSGKAVTRTMLQIFRVSAGRLIEEWSEGGSLRQQLVAAPYQRE